MSQDSGWRIVPLGDDHVIVSEWWVRGWGDLWERELPEGVNIQMHMRMIEGVPHCVEARFVSTRDDRGLPAKVVRDLRLEDWIERACMLIAHREGRKRGEDPYGFSTLPDVRRARARARGGYTDEMLAEVADIYTAAGQRPTKAVREAFGVAQSTAQLYVKKARERGFLGKADEQ